MNHNTQSRQMKYAVAAFLSVFVYVIIYKFTFNEVQADGINDIVEHTWVARDLFVATFWTQWLKRPYLFWHICVSIFEKRGKMPIEAASACVCAMFAALNYLVTFWILDRIVEKLTGKDKGIMCAFSSTVLSFAMPLYMYWYTTSQYLGQFAINTHFNPTHAAVKPFGLLAFAYAVDLLLLLRGEETIFCRSEKVKKYLFVWFGIALFMSTITKPTFMYMLLPAGVLYLLIDIIVSLVKKNDAWKDILAFIGKMALACLPSLIYLVFEYLAFYLWGGTNEDSKVAVSSFLMAWHIFSSNIPKSIMLAMAFPFLMVVTDVKYFIQSVEGRLSVICYVVGFLEFAFFIETGSKLEHLNFAWPYMSGMLILWVVAAARLGERTARDNTTKLNNLVVLVGWILFGMYLFSGFYYINPFMYIL